MTNTNQWRRQSVPETLAVEATLTTEAFNAHSRLIVHYRNQGGPLPNTDEVLARYARMTVEDFRAIKPELLQQIPTNNNQLYSVKRGKFINDSEDADIERAKAITERRRKAGIASAKARTKKPE